MLTFIRDAMRRWAADFGYRFVDSNNTRAKALWFLVFLHLAFNVVAFRSTTQNVESERPVAVQKIHNLVGRDVYMANALPEEGSRLGDWVRARRWKSLFWLILLSTFYGIVASREEVLAGLEWALHSLQKRTGRLRDLPDPRHVVAGAGGGRLTLRRFLAPLVAFVTVDLGIEGILAWVKKQTMGRITRGGESS